MQWDDAIVGTVPYSDGERHRRVIEPGGISPHSVVLDDAARSRLGRLLENFSYRRTQQRISVEFQIRCREFFVELLGELLR